MDSSSSILISQDCFGYSGSFVFLYELWFFFSFLILFIWDFFLFVFLRWKCLWILSSPPQKRKTVFSLISIVLFVVSMLFISALVFIISFLLITLDLFFLFFSIPLLLRMDCWFPVVLISWGRPILLWISLLELIFLHFVSFGALFFYFNLSLGTLDFSQYYIV